jgi:hypothetical protein
MNPQRQRLGTALRELRAPRYPSGNGFARAIGWPQSRVSKLETGTQLPTEDDIRDWTAACDTDDHVTERLLKLLAAARVEYVNARDTQRSGGLARRQVHLGELEQQTTQLREWQPALIPGLAQTPDYARELLSLPGGPRSAGATEADIDDLIAERIRRQTVLYQRGRTITLILGEAALRTPPGSIATLRAQLDRLVVLSDLATVTLAILPLHVPMPALPMSGFTLHDDDFVLIETLTAETRLDQPDEIHVYYECFQRILAASAIESDAKSLIRQITNDFDG